MTINLSSLTLYRSVVVGLLIVITGLLIWSQPWNDVNKSVNRTITATGEATIEAVPDRFIFNPYFEKTGANKDELRTSLTKKANSVVEELKKLGVNESDIKLDASSYDRWYYENDEEGVLSVSLKIDVSSSESDDLVQEVQDYLLTTGAEGQLTPQASFSEDLTKKLDAESVEKATEDAKTKALAQAGQFDAKLGKVIEVKSSDSTSRDYNELYSLEDSVSASSESLPVLAGQNEYYKSVTVKYELK